MGLEEDKFLQENGVHNAVEFALMKLLHVVQKSNPDLMTQARKEAAGVREPTAELERSESDLSKDGEDEESGHEDDAEEQKGNITSDDEASDEDSQESESSEDEENENSDKNSTKIRHSKSIRIEQDPIQTVARFLREYNNLKKSQH